MNSKIYSIIYAQPKDQSQPKAVHFNTGKTVKRWKMAFRTLYSKIDVKLRDYDVDKIDETYEKDTAILKCVEYATDKQALILKIDKNKGSWVKPTKHSQPKIVFKYYSIENVFEPEFIDMCMHLGDLTKEKGTKIIAATLYNLKIPTPSCKDRKDAFKTMFSKSVVNPDDAKNPSGCMFREARAILSTTADFKCRVAPRKKNNSGHSFPDWSDELDKELDLILDVICTIPKYFDIWNRPGVMNKICAQLNKLYEDGCQ